MLLYKIIDAATERIEKYSNLACFEPPPDASPVFPVVDDRVPSRQCVGSPQTATFS
jgi:hypothetical protein